MEKSIVSWQQAVVALSATLIGVVVVGMLYWAKIILMPVALAVFFAFLLNPLVRLLERLRLGRSLAVLIAVSAATVMLGGASWLVSRQVTGLMVELPNYTQNIRGKVKSLRTWSTGSQRLERMFEELGGEWQNGNEPRADPRPADAAARGRAGIETPPTPVVVKPEIPAWLSHLSAHLGSALEGIGIIALALGLTFFFLIDREDLRNRFVRLIGRERIFATTKAVDEAAWRVSRFLLMQIVVNGAYGMIVTLGLFLIGVEYAFLWGIMTAMLRYVPYVGVWVAGVPPVVLSLAMFETWWQPLAVVALFSTLEVLSVHAVEPLAYGRSMGISATAQLLAAAAWAFLWGPIGLVLSAPLTVVLLVMGRHVPQLRYLDVLLGAEPALEPDIAFYQRLLARDGEEAAELVRSRAAKSPEKVYDELLIPALSYARRDRQQGAMTAVEEDFILRHVRQIVADMPAGGPRNLADANGRRTAESEEQAAPIRVLGCPARDEADRLGLEMLGQLLDKGRWTMEIAAVCTLAGELLLTVENHQPALVCVGSIGPGGMSHARYLCKRLHGRFPEVRIIVGTWGERESEESGDEPLHRAGASEVATTLLATRDAVDAWLPVLRTSAAQQAAPVKRLELAGREV